MISTSSDLVTAKSIGVTRVGQKGRQDCDEMAAFAGPVSSSVEHVGQRSRLRKR
jgi:hypothetical protein